MEIPTIFTHSNKRKEKLKMTILNIGSIIYAIAFGFLFACFITAPTVDDLDLEFERRDYETATDKEKDIEIKEILGFDLSNNSDLTTENGILKVANPPIEPIFVTTPSAIPQDNIDDEEAVHAPVYFDCPLSNELQDHIYNEYLRQGFSEWCYADEFMTLIISIIQWESGFNADNTNGKCHGLMSVSTLNDGTMKAWGITDLMDPYQNITAGIHCFKNAYDWALHDPSRFWHKECSSFIDGYALLAYNKGRDGARNFLFDHNVFESDYVNNIVDSSKKYLTMLKRGD